jgi:hypothetical protein
MSSGVPLGNTEIQGSIEESFVMTFSIEIVEEGFISKKYAFSGRTISFESRGLPCRSESSE